MTRGGLSYSVGNEHSPVDPFGRSELALTPEGGARLDQYTRGRGHQAWTGRVDGEALDRLWAALDRAGFPQVPPLRLVPDATLRILTAERNGVRASASLDYHAAARLPGYDEAFDILDSIIRQLSENTVPLPAQQPTIVH